MYQQDFISPGEGGKHLKKEQGDATIDRVIHKLTEYNLINYDRHLLEGNTDLEILLGIKNTFEEST